MCIGVKNSNKSILDLSIIKFLCNSFNSTTSNCFLNLINENFKNFFSLIFKLTTFNANVFPSYPNNAQSYDSSFSVTFFHAFSISVSCFFKFRDIFTNQKKKLHQNSSSFKSRLSHLLNFEKEDE